MIWKTNKLLPLLHRLLPAAWLLAAVFNLSTVVAIESPRSPGLVFCPLQKEWVKGNQSKRRTSSLSIFETCATTAAKSEFLRKIAERTFLISSVKEFDPIDLFLDYTSKGERAFASPTELPRSPSGQISDPERLTLSIGKHRYERSATTLISSSQIELFPRSPHFDPVPNFSETHPIYSSLASTCACPRGPPSVLS